MFEFLKNVLKKVNFKSDNEELNKYNKIIYTIIILCAILFIGFIIYCAIKIIPNFIDDFRLYWRDAKGIIIT